MKNRFFFGLATLTMTCALLLPASGKTPQAIDAKKRPPVAKKVTLPCTVINKDAGSRLTMTNTTDQALTANRLVYFSTNNPDSGSFKTSSAVAAGAQFDQYVKPQQANSCQAWLFQ